MYKNQFDYDEASSLAHLIGKMPDWRATVVEYLEGYVTIASHKSGLEYDVHSAGQFVSIVEALPRALALVYGHTARVPL